MTYSQINEIKNPVKRKVFAQQAYLEYVNNFLTVERFAEYMVCTQNQAIELIKEGKHWNSLPNIESVEVSK